MSAVLSTTPNAAEPDLLSASHPDVTREHFIPLAKSLLVERLRERLPASERSDFVRWTELVDAALCHLSHLRLTELQNAYAPFDPDVEVLQPSVASAAEQARRLDRLFDQFRRLLERANFVQLTQADIEEALAAASEWGIHLHIDTAAFERLEIFARGDMVARRERCGWKTLWRRQRVEIPTYQRLAVILRLRDDPDANRPPPSGPPVLIKLFKNVPKMDVDMLFPGTQVRMTWFDRGKIMLPTVSGLALAILKIAKGAVVFAFAGVYGLLAFLIFVAGTLGYGVKSFFGYLRTKDKYHLHLTRNLYYQNLDNNAGVLTRLVSEAQDQDFREAVLAFALLRAAGETGLTAAELDEQAETWLENLLGTPVDFECHDALQKLQSWKLVEPGGDGRLTALPSAAASRCMANLWQQWIMHIGQAERTVKS